MDKSGAYRFTGHATEAEKRAILLSAAEKL
jgi:hypothetical protein